NFYMIAGAGGNIGVQVGDDGVVVVDTGTRANSDRVLAEVKKIANNKTIRFIINTSADADHVGGNEKISQVGRPLGGGGGGGGGFGATGAAIMARVEVLDRMSAAVDGKALYTTNFLPTSTFSHPQKNIYFNGEAIEMLDQPAAHTDGDLMVF